AGYSYLVAKLKDGIGWTITGMFEDEQRCQAIGFGHVIEWPAQVARIEYPGRASHGRTYEQPGIVRPRLVNIDLGTSNIAHPATAQPVVEGDDAKCLDIREPMRKASVTGGSMLEDLQDIARPFRITKRVVATIAGTIVSHFLPQNV